MKLGRACGDPPQTAGGCSTGQMCLPKPSPPFASGLCIEHPGDVLCPAGAFAAKHVFYGGVNDMRNCDACTGGGALGGSCATVTVYSSATCTNAPIATIKDGSCAAIASNPDVAGRKLTIGPVTGGSCAPLGGTPIGTATESNPTTFCCIP